MQMETDSHPSPDSRGVDGAINRLRRDLLDTPPVTPEPDDMTDQPDEPDIIDYASVEFEVERMRKRLAVWEIFMAYMRDGARSWSQVQQASGIGQSVRDKNRKGRPPGPSPLSPTTLFAADASGPPIMAFVTIDELPTIKDSVRRPVNRGSLFHVIRKIMSTSLRRRWIRGTMQKSDGNRNHPA